MRKIYLASLSMIFVLACAFHVYSMSKVTISFSSFETLYTLALLGFVQVGMYYISLKTIMKKKEIFFRPMLFKKQYMNDLSKWEKPRMISYIITALVLSGLLGAFFGYFDLIDFVTSLMHFSFLSLTLFLMMEKLVVKYCEIHLVK